MPLYDSRHLLQFQDSLDSYVVVLYKNMEYNNLSDYAGTDITTLCLRSARTQKTLMSVGMEAMPRMPMRVCGE